MSSILVVTEIQGGKVREASFELVTLARKLAEASGREVKSLVIGNGVADTASDFAAKGGGETFVADDAGLAPEQAPQGRLPQRGRAAEEPFFGLALGEFEGAAFE